MIVLVDMDGIVSDFVGSVLARYNSDHNDTLTHEDIKSNDMHKYTKLGVEFYDYFHQEGLFADCEAFKDAQTILSQLVEDGNQVVFVTKPVNFSLHCMAEKQHWVNKHFPTIGHKNMVFTGHKHLVRGDVLIDDLASNLENFQGTRLLLDQPWNRHTNPPGVIRCKDWWDIYASLLLISN